MGDEPEEQRDPHAVMRERLSKAPPPGQIVEGQSMKAVIDSARRSIEGKSPRAAELLLLQLEMLAEFTTTDLKTAMGLKDFKGLTKAQRLRFMMQNRRLALQASRRLHETIDTILAYSMGYPTQEHKVTHSDEITETARVLADFGPKFLTELRKVLIAKAKESEAVSGGERPPALSPDMEVQVSVVEEPERRGQAESPTPGAPDSEG